MNIRDRIEFNRHLDEFYSRMELKTVLDEDIRCCVRCKGLNESGTECCPGYGNVCSPIMFVGQSLCDRCRLTQVPFTRGSGDLLEEAMWSAGRRKYEFFTTNVVHCHPPKNRASTSVEIRNCRPFLLKEIEVVRPALIVCLGADARRAMFGIFGIKSAAAFEVVERKSSNGVCVTWVAHPASFLYTRSVDGKREWVKRLAALITKFSC